MYSGDLSVLELNAGIGVLSDTKSNPVGSILHGSRNQSMMAVFAIIWDIILPQNHQHLYHQRNC